MRVSKDEWAMRLAEVTATRGTCLRRQVGCVLTDAEGRVLATGYNGVARGLPHCNEVTETSAKAMPLGCRGILTNLVYGNACPGAAAPSGEGLDACEAVHAEQSALTQCRDPDRVWSCYVTVSPCASCLKLLLNTGCRRVVFRQPYAQDASGLWTKAGREWIRL